MMMNWMAQMIHKRQRQMRRMMNGGQNNFVSGMMLGAMAGAVAGLMFAPKPGKDLRMDIVEKAGQALGGATEKTKQFGQSVKKTAQQVQSNIQDTVNQASNAAGKSPANPPA